MARLQTVSDADLASRLADVFRDVGYGAASIDMLAEATGLRRASLYHRFPNGKEQMAQEVLSAAGTWFGENVIAALRGSGDPGARLQQAVLQLDDFYARGSKGCLLNMLASPRADDGPFSAAIRDMLEAWVQAFAVVARDSGFATREGQRRAEQGVMLVQGGLVLSRGLQRSEPFQRALAALPALLLKDKPS